MDRMPHLTEIKGADPESDALNSIKYGDLRFAGIWSHILSVPEIPKKLINKYGAKGIEGTGDLRAVEEEPLYKIAEKYVRAYNKIILKEIGK